MKIGSIQKIFFTPPNIIADLNSMQNVSQKKWSVMVVDPAVSVFKHLPVPIKNVPFVQRF